MVIYDYTGIIGQAIPGSNPNLVMLKLYMSSLEYQRIYNFPQPGAAIFLIFFDIWNCSNL